jgi:predicted nucleic-acid-binding protein
MIAFDTNLLVRFLFDDDKAQADLAEALMRHNSVFISRTVLLETEWVLRSRYGQERRVLADLFERLLEVENVEMEDRDLVASAVQWFHLGTDFADALHLAVCGTAVMHTFDKAFCKEARATGAAPNIRILEVESAGRSAQ